MSASVFAFQATPNTARAELLKSIFYVYHPIDNKTIIQTLILLFQKNVYTRNQKSKER